ncbi:MAG: type II CAAX endopeptidase family protein [Pyrinomonadaceae bacterium]
MQEIITDAPEAFKSPQPPALAAIERPTPNNPPWNSGVAIGTWFVSVLLIVLVPSLILLPYVLSIAGGYADNASMVEFIKTDPTAIMLQIAAVIPAHILTIILAWFVVTRMRTFSFREALGWNSGGMVWWHYAVIAIGFFVVASVVGNFFPEQENELIRILKSSRTAVYFVAFMATFTAPLVEEVIYRGILYSAFQRTFGVVFAVISVTFLFALVHVPQYYPSFSTIILLTVLSLILTLIRVRTDNLLPCIILHTIFNGIQSVVLILEPYLSIETPAKEIVPSAIFHLLK